MILVLGIAVGVLFATGTYLLLQRALTRLVIGLSLLAHGANVILLAAAGRPGRPPFADGSDGVGVFTDPLPQAMILTAIVITFGVTAFLLTLAYRSWQLTRDDEVEDDVEDRRIARIGRQETPR